MTNTPCPTCLPSSCRRLPPSILPSQTKEKVMRSWIARRILSKMSKRYDYDVSYLEMMLSESPAAFFKFAPVMKAAGHREVVPIEASFTAKIIGALAADCGPCTQLVVDMALEAGVARD